MDILFNIEVSLEDVSAELAKLGVPQNLPRCLDKMIVCKTFFFKRHSITPHFSDLPLALNLFQEHVPNLIC